VISYPTSKSRNRVDRKALDILTSVVLRVLTAGVV
jgi:hypothetical protein